MFRNEEKQLTELLVIYNKNLEAERLLKIMPILSLLADDPNRDEYEVESADQYNDKVRNNTFKAFKEHPVLSRASALVTFPVFLVKSFYMDYVLLGSMQDNYTGRVKPISQLLKIIKKTESIEKNYSKNIFDSALQQKLLVELEENKNQIENWTRNSDRNERYNLLIQTVDSIQSKVKIIFENAHDEMQTVCKNSSVIAQLMVAKNGFFRKLPNEMSTCIAAFSGEKRNFYSADKLEETAYNVIQVYPVKKI